MDSAGHMQGTFVPQTSTISLDSGQWWLWQVLYIRQDIHTYTYVHMYAHVHNKVDWCAAPSALRNKKHVSTFLCYSPPHKKGSTSESCTQPLLTSGSLSDSASSSVGLCVSASGSSEESDTSSVTFACGFAYTRRRKEWMRVGGNPQLLPLPCLHAKYPTTGNTHSSSITKVVETTQWSASLT